MRIVPLAILAVMYLWSFGYECGRHGEPRGTKYNGWTAFISLILQSGLIWWAIQ